MEIKEMEDIDLQKIRESLSQKGCQIILKGNLTADAYYKEIKGKSKWMTRLLVTTGSKRQGNNNGGWYWSKQVFSCIFWGVDFMRYIKREGGYMGFKVEITGEFQLKKEKQKNGFYKYHANVMGESIRIEDSPLVALLVLDEAPAKEPVEAEAPGEPQLKVLVEEDKATPKISRDEKREEVLERFRKDSGA